MPPILYLIDGHALAYRTYFALMSSGGNRFQTSSGEPTAGTFGFASALLRLLEQDRPEYLAVAFDTGKTFRNDKFPAYKATRAKMPEDLRPQIIRIRQMVDTFKIPRLEMEGFEADDVLGSIARQAASQGFGVKIITGDRDLLQLVDDRIIVNLAGRKLSEAKDYTPKDVVNLLSVRPEQVVDYKALVGDTSDNIPGVYGIGKKTAAPLLEKYSTLDEIYQHLDELPLRVRNKLEAGQDAAYLSRDLATIRTDVKITLDLETARTSQLDLAAVETLFNELEFRTLIRRLHSLGQPSDMTRKKQQLSLFGEEVARVGFASDYETTVHLVNDLEGLKKLQEKLASSLWISLDTETTSVEPMRAKLVGISLATQAGEGYYIPTGHHTGDRQLPEELVLEALRPFLTDGEKKIIGHNLKYDGLVLTRYGLKPTSYEFDTMIAEWLIEPSSRRLGLKDVADRYLHVNMTRIEELIGKGKNQLNMADVPVDKVAPYAAADADIPFQLQPILQKRLEEQNALELFNNVEMPLIPVLADMEQAGITLDVPFFKQMSDELHERAAVIKRKVFDTIGYEFNLNSTQQLSKALFDSLKLVPPYRGKKTASGHYSTSAAVLDQMRGNHPVVDWVLEYRELAKLKSTYVDTLPQQINHETQRVHTSFNQTGSVTGRLASSKPNLQNIPIRTELGQRVRRGFIAEEADSVLLTVDYSQIELRIVASMSNDEAMLNAFLKGQDIHITTASAVFGTPIDQVSKEQRRQAKAINFGLIYGMSAFGLSHNTGLTLAESEDFVQAYFEQFPGVKNFLDTLRRTAASEGYVETLLGRRRYFPNLSTHSNSNLRKREEREAINAPIQGTAADIMKLAMIQLPPVLRKEKLNARIILQVHDELMLECPKTELEYTTRTVQNVMENVYRIACPLLTDARWGTNWGEMQTISHS